MDRTTEADTKMKYAVRCCCVPVKVMGWLELPKDCPDHLTVAMYQSKPINYWKEKEDFFQPIREQAEIQLKTYVHLNGSWERAVYSDDRPMSFWLKIPGFIPNTEFRDES